MPQIEANVVRQVDVFYYLARRVAFAFSGLSYTIHRVSIWYLYEGQIS